MLNFVSKTSTSPSTTERYNKNMNKTTVTSKVDF